jgi:hypothetical protein
MECPLYFLGMILGSCEFMNSAQMANGWMENSLLEPGKSMTVGKITVQVSQLFYLFQVIIPAQSCSLEAMMSVFGFTISKAGAPSWQRRKWEAGYGD